MDPIRSRCRGAVRLSWARLGRDSNEKAGLGNLSWDVLAGIWMVLPAVVAADVSRPGTRFVRPGHGCNGIGSVLDHGRFVINRGVGSRQVDSRRRGSRTNKNDLRHQWTAS